MAERFTTCKVTPDVLAMVRAISAKTGEKHYGLLRRLLKTEAKIQHIRLSRTQ